MSDISVTVKPLKEVEERIAATTGKPLRWRWYHGVIFYVLTQAVTFGLTGLVSIARGHKEKNARETFFGDVPYFKRLKQLKITPPSSAFGPVWTLNNISTIYGNLRALNLPEKTPGRSAYLQLQAASWLNYAIFNAAYFSLRSPINAMVLTLSMFGLTIASMLVSIFKLKDTRIALSLATLFLWLALASTVAVAQALWNRDDLYNVGPFTEPNPALVKKKVS